MKLLSKFPRLTMMCCCVPLRTGTIFLAVLQILGCLVSIFSIAFTDPQDILIKDVNQPTGNLSNTTETDTVQKPLELEATVIYSSLLGEVFVLTFAIILLVGAFQRNVRLVKFYVVFNFIGILILIPLIILTAIFIPLYGLILAIILLISIYYLLCINSFLQILIIRHHRIPQMDIVYKNEAEERLS